MKKLKYILISALVCLACMLFASCAEASYIEDSFSSSARNYGHFISADYSFRVNLPSTGNYEVTYRITLYDQSGNTVENTNKRSTVSGLGKQTVSSNVTFDFDTPVNENATYTIKISDVKVTATESKDEYVSYAIGFGITGGVLLVGATVYFILSKLKEKNRA